MKEILNIENFDPMKVDVSFLKEVSKQIPEEGFMDPAMAEHLATATLKAADLCIDLLGQSTLYLADCDARRRAAKAIVIKRLLDAKKPSTVVKEIFADDPEYIKVSNQYNQASALHVWLENKHGALIKTHHLCKDFIKKAETLQGASGWEPRTEETPRASGKSSWNV